MNWEIAGVVAEVVGAVTVVATLIYLSVQIRLAREATQVQSSYTALEIFGAWRNHLIENRDLAATVASVNRGESISDEEEIQLRTLMDDFFFDVALSHASGVKSNVLYDSSAEADYVERILIQNPGLVRYWAQTRGYLVKSFSAFVEVIEQRLESKKIMCESVEAPNNSRPTNA